MTETLSTIHLIFVWLACIVAYIFLTDRKNIKGVALPSENSGMHLQSLSWQRHWGYLGWGKARALART